MTPEGRVKAALNRTIKKFPAVRKMMAVPSGFGPSDLDYVLCVPAPYLGIGFYVAIETKAPGKVPTPRQLGMMADIRAAHGIVMAIDNVEDAKNIEPLLRLLTSVRTCSRLQ